MKKKRLKKKSKIAQIPWSALSENQKISRLKKAYDHLHRVGAEQIKLLDEYEKNINNPKDLRHLFLMDGIKMCWEYSGLAVSLRNGKYKSLIKLPVRSVMEKTLQLIYFTNHLKGQAQDNAVLNNLARSAWVFWKSAVTNGHINDIANYKKQYQFFAQSSDLPAIDDVKNKDFKVFPNTWELCQKVPIAGLDGNALYFYYEFLSGATHGDLLHTVMNKNDNKGEFRRALMFLMVLCREILVLTDFHLGNTTKTKVDSAIEATRQVARI